MRRARALEVEPLGRAMGADLKINNERDVLLVRITIVMYSKITFVILTV
jgi:hypothetical protein